MAIQVTIASNDPSGVSTVTIPDGVNCEVDPHGYLYVRRDQTTVATFHRDHWREVKTLDPVPEVHVGRGALDQRLSDRYPQADFIVAPGLCLQDLHPDDDHIPVLTYPGQTFYFDDGSQAVGGES